MRNINCSTIYWITCLFQIEAGEVKKQYIARVIGVFPENEVLIVVLHIFVRILGLDHKCFNSIAFLSHWVLLMNLGLHCTIFPWQQVVNMNINYNAREGKSTVEVQITILGHRCAIFLLISFLYARVQSCLLSSEFQVYHYWCLAYLLSYSASF